MRKPSPVLLLIGVLIIMMAVYVFALLGYDSPAILILGGLVILLYLMYQTHSDE